MWLSLRPCASAPPYPPSKNGMRYALFCEYAFATTGRHAMGEELQDRVALVSGATDGSGSWP